MELSVLVGYMKARLAERRTMVQPPHPTQLKDYYSNHQAQMTLGLLEEVIAQLEKYIKPANENEAPIDPPVNADHIKIITNFFDFRWQMIKNTDESYFIHNNSPVNLLCLDIAQFLARDNHFVGERNKYELLMPTVVSWFNPLSNHFLQDYYPHNMMLTDEATDGTHGIIEMGYLYPPQVDNKGRLVLNYNLDGVDVELSHDEVARVQGHSSLTKNYYDDFIRRRLKNANAEPNEKMEKELHKALRHTCYEGHQVTATYGESGLSLLKKNLLNNVNRMFINREQLLNYLSTNIEAKKWGEFLESMHPDVFFNLMTGADNTLPEQKKSPKLSRLDNTLVNLGDYSFTLSKAYNNALLYCLVSSYWQVRDEDPRTYANVLGLFGRWDKPSKHAAVEEMKKLLVKEMPYDDESVRNAFLDADAVSAKNDGTLGRIFKLMCKQLKPVVIKEQEDNSCASPMMGAK